MAFAILLLNTIEHRKVTKVVILKLLTGVKLKELFSKHASFSRLGGKKKKKNNFKDYIFQLCFYSLVNLVVY